MTTNSSDRGGNGSGGILRSPAIGKLKEAAGAYAAAKGVKLASRAGQRMTGLTGKLEDVSQNGGSLGSIGQVAKGVVGGGGDSEGEGGILKTAASKVTDKVKSAVAGRGKKSGKSKSTNIIESIDVGVPLRVAYDQWTQFSDFSRFTKGVQSVDQKDETTSSWRAKIWWSTRTWEGKVVEQIPDQRIVWTTEGPKGTHKGVVTFHELAPELTRVLLDIEYFPSGVVEKTANLWRPAGRRTRLDLKHYRRFIMMEGEATGSWRGRIEDGEVVSEGDEDEQGEDQGQEPDRDEMSEQDSDRAEDSEQDSTEDSEDSEEDEEPEEDESERRSRRRARDEEPDEDSEEEPEEEPEEETDEEPAPRRTRSRRSEPDSNGDAAPRRARRTRAPAASRGR